MKRAPIQEADELADALMIVHENDARAAHDEAREIATTATQNGDAAVARLHTLAADTIVAQHPEHFRD